MILLLLFGVFARIGAFTFGGGYAMVTIIERDLTDRGWLTTAEFADVVAVSQMTPGPLALNVATYAGRQVAGVPGALAASAGLAFPALFIAAAAMLAVRTGRRLFWARAAVRGIRGAVPGLIATSVLFFLETSVITGVPEPPYGTSVRAPIHFSPVFVIALIAAGRFRQGPVRVIAGAAVLGVLLHIAGWTPIF